MNSVPSLYYDHIPNAHYDNWTQAYDFDTIDGTYDVPLAPQYISNKWACSGIAEFPFEGRLSHWHNTGWGSCEGAVQGELWWETVFDKIRVRVDSWYAPTNPPYTGYYVGVSVWIVDTSGAIVQLFSGTEYKPITEKTCYSNQMQNAYQTPYVCQMHYTPWPNEHTWIDWRSSWGGTATIEPIGTYQFPIWLTTLSGPNLLSSYGNRYVQAYCAFGNLVCPGFANGFKVQYKVTCNLGTFISESPRIYSADVFSLGVNVPSGGQLGFTTFEITDIVPLDPNIVWDRARDTAPSIITRVFE